jgi:hypothetical protein
LRTAAQAHTSPEKCRHAKYPPIAQPPPAIDNNDDEGAVPQGEDFLAAADAAESGKKVVGVSFFQETMLTLILQPTPSKVGLGKYPHLRRVTAATILDMLASACLKGIYQSPQAYQNWVLDGYRRVWGNLHKDRRYVPAPDDLLPTLSAPDVNSVPLLPEALRWRRGCCGFVQK